MTLEDTLLEICGYIGVNAESFLTALNEVLPDEYNPQPMDNSLAEHGSEGMLLYSLVRGLQPKRVLEIGNLSGNSTRHLIKALRKNGEGHLWTVDCYNWQAVAPEDEDVATPILSDLFRYDYAQVAPIDFLFDDCGHTSDMVEHIWRAFMQHSSPGAVIVSHDAGHVELGPRVREGIERISAEYRIFKPEQSQCGFAIGMQRLL